MKLSELLSDHDKKDAHGLPADTLRGAMAAAGKRQSMISSTTSTAGGTSAVPRSTSQPGNTPSAICFVSFQLYVLISWCKPGYYVVWLFLLSR